MPIRELMFYVPGTIAPKENVTFEDLTQRVKEKVALFASMTSEERDAYFSALNQTPKILVRLTTLLNGGPDGSAVGTWKRYGNGIFGIDGEDRSVKTSVFSVEDFDLAEARARELLAGTEFQDTWAAYRWYEARDETSADAPYKSIEVYYAISDIPPDYTDPLDFRNAALELIETALEETGEGEWVGAEIGIGEVNFGFEVTNFKNAEKIVRSSVKGTPFECINRITRYDSSKA